MPGGALHSWNEEDLRVNLIEGHVDLAARNTGIATLMLRHLERAASNLSDAASPHPAVVGANATDQQADRQQLLTDNRYTSALSVVEMRLAHASDVVPATGEPAPRSESATQHPRMHPHYTK